MALKPCRVCRVDVAEDAKFCSHCGAPRPVPPTWPAVFALASVLLLAGTCFLGGGDDEQAEPPSAPDARAQRIRARLAYLDSVPEIAWREVDRNDVYLGWRSIPEDFRLVNVMAALHANEAADFGAHIWSVSGGAPGWRPGDPGLICETTARYGKLEDSDCR
jgi:hypothetical protein